MNDLGYPNREGRGPLSIPGPPVRRFGDGRHGWSWADRVRLCILGLAHTRFDLLSARSASLQQTQHEGLELMPGPFCPLLCITQSRL